MGSPVHSTFIRQGRFDNGLQRGNGDGGDVQITSRARAITLKTSGDD